MLFKFLVFIKFVRALIPVFIVFLSCKRNHVCTCKELNIFTKTNSIVSTEVIHDKNSIAKEKCSTKWCGDECGCELK